MKTVLEFDNYRGKFHKKKSILSLFDRGTMEPLGETDFDLAKYANDEKPHEDKLVLRGGPDPESWIEIFIRAKVLDKVAQTPNMSVMIMPIIEEKDSEQDFYEELQK